MPKFLVAPPRAWLGRRRSETAWQRGRAAGCRAATRARAGARSHWAHHAIGARCFAPSELTAFKSCSNGGAPESRFAYLLGEREFYGILLRVDARVLIPRPDSERLVEVALERTRQRSMSAPRSTCAPARVAWRLPLRVNVRRGALPRRTFRRRRSRLLAATRIAPVPCANLRLLQGSLFAPVSSERFDLISANPPYIPAGGICGAADRRARLRATAGARRRGRPAWPSCATLPLRRPAT